MGAGHRPTLPAVGESRFQVLRRRVINEAVQQGWRRLRQAGGIAPGTIAAERFGSFGDGSIVGFPTATLYGQGQMHIGEETLIGCWSTLATGYSPDQTTVPPRAMVIGDRCVIGLRCGIVAHESIEIADDVWFGQDVFVSDSSHGYQDLETPIGQQLGAHQPVSIGSGTWIGHGAIILPGVAVGDGAVIGAGAVVTKDVDPYTIVGGVPAKPIRQRFDRKTAERYQALAWWNWDHSRLRAALDDFRHLSAEAFLDKHGG